MSELKDMQAMVLAGADRIAALRAEVADLKRRIRLARKAMKGSGAPWTLELEDLLDLRRPLPPRRWR